MAFDRSNAQRNNSNSDSNGTPAWKAQGFINIYLPTKEGGRRKLAGIPLKDSNASQKGLREWLAADPARVEILLGKLEMEYQGAEQSTGSGFDLSEEPDTE